MSLIEFEDRDGKIVGIDPDDVHCVIEDYSVDERRDYQVVHGSTLYFRNGKNVFVRHTVREVLDDLKTAGITAGD